MQLRKENVLFSSCNLTANGFGIFSIDQDISESLWLSNTCKDVLAKMFAIKTLNVSFRI